MTFPSKYIYTVIATVKIDPKVLANTTIHCSVIKLSACQPKTT